jgi:hypothetical protein
MARRKRERLLDDETMQELHSEQLSGASSNSDSDKSSNDDEEDDEDDFGHSLLNNHNLAHNISRENARETHFHLIIAYCKF